MTERKQLFAQTYDQTTLELCDVCGWKTLVPGDCCVNCRRDELEAQLEAETADLSVAYFMGLHAGKKCGTPAPTFHKDERGYAAMYRAALAPAPSQAAPVDAAVLRDAAIEMLADWVHAVNTNGTGWDDWDEHFKDAAFRPGPLRELLDEAIAAKQGGQ